MSSVHLDAPQHGRGQNKGKGAAPQIGVTRLAGRNVRDVKWCIRDIDLSVFKKGRCNLDKNVPNVLSVTYVGQSSRSNVSWVKYFRLY